MRHLKHRHELGVKKAHRIALMANLACALIKEGRIKTTLAKAKALRPFIEKLITLAKSGSIADRRVVSSRIRNKDAVQVLFNEKVEEFKNRAGGYTRIYKIGNRIGDGAEMALIELIPASDEGYAKKKKKKAKKPTAKPAGDETIQDNTVEDAAETEGPVGAESNSEVEAKADPEETPPAKDEPEAGEETKK